MAALVATLPASATSVPHMSFERVVRDSPRAFRGVVVRSWSAWDDARAAIWTHYEIRVTETLRGSAQAMFTLSEPGGAVGNLAMQVPGAPRFAVGEEAVVFAYPTPIGYWRVQGWGQGLFRIETQGGRRIVQSPSPGVLLLDARTGKAKTPSASPNMDGRSVESFLESVRSLIRVEEGR
jgi:hypothetical protein